MVFTPKSNTMEFTPVSTDKRDDILEFWNKKFDVPRSVFKDHRFVMKGKNKVWITDGVSPDLRYESVGLPFLRVNREHPKPTTDALQRFGSYITKNTVDVDRERAKTFVNGGTVEDEYSVDSGYVAVRYLEEVLGCGLYFPGEIRSQVPKGRRVDLRIP